MEFEVYEEKTLILYYIFSSWTSKIVRVLKFIEFGPKMWMLLIFKR